MTHDHTHKEIARMKAQIETIKHAVTQHFGITPPELLTSKKRHEPLAVQRQVAMYLSKKLTLASLADVARAFDRKDHGTIAHAVAVIEHDLTLDPEQARVQKSVETIRKVVEKIFARHV
jgi:chromosomal replication initiator protein